MARPSSPARGPDPVLPRRLAGPPATPVPWSGHEESRRVRRVLQGRARPPAPPDLCAHRGPARVPVRGPRRLRRGLAPLAQGLPARRPRVVGAPARLGARPAPPHRAALAPRQGPRPRGPRHPGRARQAADDPAQDPAADPPDLGVDGRHGPRGRAAPRRGRARAADRHRPVRGPPRRGLHEHPGPVRAAARAHRVRPLAPVHDHPTRGRQAPAYPHRGGSRGRRRRAGPHRRPGHRRGRRSARPCTTRTSPRPPPSSGAPPRAPGRRPRRCPSRRC